ncbi:hypothetical protein OIV83_000689 [Microbotryomycetes sp. JL201]|nr:hypothetical protein OIV83_000689 [Microbotryomycetes sp. JL201]
MLGFHRRSHFDSSNLSASSTRTDLSDNSASSSSSSASSSKSRASTSKQIWQPIHDCSAKTDMDLLVFLPTLNCVALPEGFQPPPHLWATGTKERTLKEKTKVSTRGYKDFDRDPTLLAFYGTQQQAVKSIGTASALIDLSRLKESLWEEFELDDSLTELTMTLDPPCPPGSKPSKNQQCLSAGWLVRVTVYLRGQPCPDFAGTGGRWTTCGEHWRYNSPCASLGSVYVEFVA